MVRLHRESNPDAVSASERKRYAKNKEKRAASLAEWRKKNRPASLEIMRRASKAWRLRNTERVRESARKHAKQNPEQYAARAALRRARIARAVPRWLSKEQKKEISRIYEDAKDRSSGGVPHHVDHIIPIAGDGVVGLHVPWNLRVLPAHINQVKWKHYGNETPTD